MNGQRRIDKAKGTPLQALKKQGDGLSDRLGKAERSRLAV